jgi:hypothetical protein
MKKTAPLSANRWWPKINQPLPQTPRESQQLLSALTSSFRRQLDAADTIKPAQSANQHLQSILENPLFRVVPPKPLVPPAGVGAEKVRLRKKMAESPMAVFDDLAAAGKLTATDIGDCLNAQLLRLGKSRKNLRDQTKNAGTGAKVLEWFWASDYTARLSFFTEVRSLQQALKFMAAEDLHDQITSLFRELDNLKLNSAMISPEDGKRMSGAFFRSYVIAEIHYGRGLAVALQKFSTVCSMAEPEKRDTLLPTAVYIARFIAERGSKRRKRVPASVFEDFCDALDGISGLQVWQKAMRVYHPSHPDARPLLKHIQSAHGESTPPREKFLIQVYLDAMRLLIEQKRLKAAQQLSAHIEKILSDKPDRTVEAYDHSELSELMGRLNLALG